MAAMAPRPRRTIGYRDLRLSNSSVSPARRRGLPTSPAGQVSESAWKITPKLSAMKCSGSSTASTIRMSGSALTRIIR